ncbi:MAG: hypothetical protein PHU49_08675 [Syntrophorhabdaceae bacterium]|nr:hypothetical protein [Syntrophorhabdaceae bacterium]
MPKKIVFFEDNRLKKQVIIEDSRVIFELVGKHKDGSLMPLQYVSVNIKDLETVYHAVKERM